MNYSSNLFVHAESRTQIRLNVFENWNFSFCDFRCLRGENFFSRYVTINMKANTNWSLNSFSSESIAISISRHIITSTLCVNLRIELQIKINISLARTHKSEHRFLSLVSPSSINLNNFMWKTIKSPAREIMAIKNPFADPLKPVEIKKGVKHDSFVSPLLVC